VPRAQIQEMADWVIAHSPVGHDFEPAVECAVELEVI
jgi:hypothetical protein